MQDSRRPTAAALAAIFFLWSCGSLPGSTGACACPEPSPEQVQAPFQVSKISIPATGSAVTDVAQEFFGTGEEQVLCGQGAGGVNIEIPSTTTFFFVFDDPIDPNTFDSATAVTLQTTQGSVGGTSSLTCQAVCNDTIQFVPSTPLPSGDQIAFPTQIFSDTLRNTNGDALVFGGALGGICQVTVTT